MRRVLNDVELTHTRRELSELERLYEAHEHETGGDEKLREMSMESLEKHIRKVHRRQKQERTTRILLIPLPVTDRAGLRLDGRGRLRQDAMVQLLTEVQ